MKICPVCSREYPSGTFMCSEDGVALVVQSTAATQKPEDLVGQTVEGRYRIEGVLGKGGMGVVYACRHVVVGKRLAMKVLRAGVERSEGVLARFIREAQTANAIKSRHIAETFDFGQLPNGSFFVAMELLDGEDLTHALKRGALGRRDLIHVFEQVAETLQLAHDSGVIHRDLKPDNVFLVEEGQDRFFVKLLDFGIAKVMDEEASNFTETGVILGTPYYMSPEQARGERIDHRSDVYALGVMMYRAFTGKLPFLADSTMGVLTRHLTELPELPSRITSIEPSLERVILKCLEKVPEARFQSMLEVAKALQGVMAPRPTVQDDPTFVEGARATLDEGNAKPPMLSGPHAPAHEGTPHSGPSGAYATSGAYAASGAHPHAGFVSGPQAPVSGPVSGPRSVQSGAYAHAPSYPPPSGPMSSGAHAAFPAGVPTPVSVPPMQTPSSGHAPLSISTPPPMSGRAPSGDTSRVFASTGQHAPVKRSPLVLVLAALAMLVLGAGLATFIFRLGRASAVAPASDGAEPSSRATTSATTAPSVTATSATTADTASPSASAAATGAPSASAAAAEPTLKGRLPPAPAPSTKPTAAPTVAPTTAPTAPRKAPEIRSPFD